MTKLLLMRTRKGEDIFLKKGAIFTQNITVTCVKYLIWGGIFSKKKKYFNFDFKNTNQFLNG